MKPLTEIIYENLKSGLERTCHPGGATTIPVATLDQLVQALTVARASMTDILSFGVNSRSLGNIRNVDMPIIERAISAGQRAQAAPTIATGDFSTVTSTLEVAVVDDAVIVDVLNLVLQDGCSNHVRRQIEKILLPEERKPKPAPLKPVWRPGLSDVLAGGIKIQAGSHECFVSVDYPDNPNVSVVCLTRALAEDLVDVLEGEDSVFFGTCLYEVDDVLRVNRTHDKDGDIEFMFPIMEDSVTYKLAVIGEDDAAALAAFIRKGLEATA